MLEWNVFYFNRNKKDIDKINIFNHYSFYEQLAKSARKYSNDFEGFKTDLKNNLFYFFWTKCEYEIIIGSYPHKEEYMKKLDAYEQIMLNFDRFAQYVWDNKTDIKEI